MFKLANLRRKPPNPNLNVFMRHDPVHDGFGYVVCELLALGLIAIATGALLALFMCVGAV